MGFHSKFTQQMQTYSLDVGTHGYRLGWGVDTSKQQGTTIHETFCTQFSDSTFCKLAIGKIIQKNENVNMIKDKN